MSKYRVAPAVSVADEPTPASSDPEAPVEPVRLAELGSKLREKLWTLPGDSANNIARAEDEALDVYETLDPRNIEEELVAERLVLARAAANVCMRAAYGLMHRTESVRLLNLYRGFSDEELKWKREWDKGRGRADQVVRVVNVKDGGQAMIGNVHLAPKGNSQTTQTKVETSLPPGIRPPRKKRVSASRGGKG